MKCTSKWTVESVQIAQDDTNKRDLSFGLNPQINNPKFVKNFQDSWNKEQKLTTKEVKLTNGPFQIATISSFLENPDQLIPELVEEFSDVEWNRKEMDLYKFFQSKDLVSVETPLISKFYQFLQSDVKPWMENLTNMKFKHVSASCSMYNYSDHLLIHDDLLTDRKIAFVYYLSPWVGSWDEKMGGALEFYKTDEKSLPVFPIVSSVFPSNNQLAFFKVSKKSFHSVGEVLTKDYPRLTLHGWFHGEVNPDYEESTKLKGVEKSIFACPKPKISLKLEDFINKTYLEPKIKKTIQKSIEADSEIALEEFLLEDFYNKVSLELISAKLKWKIKNPAHQKYYEYLRTDDFPDSLKTLFDLFSSSKMFQFLYEITELDLYGKQSKKPTFHGEIQRWTGGNYTLIGDQASFNDSTLDLIFYFGSNENIGVVTYLTPEENDSEVDPVLLTIYPRPNAMNVVYRAEGTTKFTKYVPKHCGKDQYNYILVLSYKE